MSIASGRVEAHRPMREIKMEEWKELVELAVDLAGSEDLMDTGEREYVGKESQEERGVRNERERKREEERERVRRGRE